MDINDKPLEVKVVRCGIGYQVQMRDEHNKIWTLGYEAVNRLLRNPATIEMVAQALRDHDIKTWVSKEKP
jgi:hypothetical protein